jgi:hypothetical protein
MATLAELQQLVVTKTDKVAKTGYRLDKKVKAKEGKEAEVVSLNVVIQALTADINLLTIDLESSQQALITSINKLCSHADYTDV